jgi:hypothetical protein
LLISKNGSGNFGNGDSGTRIYFSRPFAARNGALCFIRELFYIRVIPSPNLKVIKNVSDAGGELRLWQLRTKRCMYRWQASMEAPLVSIHVLDSFDNELRLMT